VLLRVRLSEGLVVRSSGGPEAVASESWWFLHPEVMVDADDPSL